MVEGRILLQRHREVGLRLWDDPKGTVCLLQDRENGAATVLAEWNARIVTIQQIREEADRALFQTRLTDAIVKQGAQKIDY